MLMMFGFGLEAKVLDLDFDLGFALPGLALDFVAYLTSLLQLGRFPNVVLTF